MKKRDFFGREIVNSATVEATRLSTGVEGGKGGGKGSGSHGGIGRGSGADGRPKIWVTFHEGFSNAVRKPIGMRELMDGFTI